MPPSRDGVSVDHGFPPLEQADARVLVLGSLPGQVSLQQRQYYAQPRNTFWRIMGELFGARPELPYAERVEALLRNGVAVWDVCASARRPGSLDSAIEHATVEVNDFAAFFAHHPKVARVCFNGATAARLYTRNVLPTLAPRARELETRLLPSTSPAHAGMPFGKKLAIWTTALS